jgi:hypothetical protein
MRKKEAAATAAPHNAVKAQSHSHLFSSSFESAAHAPHPTATAPEVHVKLVKTDTLKLQTGDRMEKPETTNIPSPCSNTQS